MLAKQQGAIISSMRSTHLSNGKMINPGSFLGFLGLCLCAWLLLVGQAFASQAVLDVTQVDLEAVSLTHYFAILEDPGASLTLADVSQPGVAARFKTGQAPGHALGFAFTRSAIWLRLHLKNPSDQPVERVLDISYALLASVDLYQPSGQSYQSIQVGYSRPVPAQALPSRFIALPISLPAGADQQVYLRVQTPNSLNIPARLWSPQAFHSRAPADFALQSLYFGIVLALAVYNLILFLALRDINYLFYVICSFGVALGLATFTGMGSTFLWGFAPLWTKIGVNVPAALASVAMLVFTRRLLATRQTVPRLDPWLKLLTAANFAFFFLLIFWFLEVNPFFVVLSLVTSLFIWVVGVVCAHKGQRSAYFFIMAFSVLLLANVLTHLRNLGLVLTNFFTSDGLQIGSVFEMLLLSLALADRFNMLRREKIAAQTQALHVQGELVEQLQASERLLESRVLERTAQLQQNLAALRLRDEALNQISQGVVITNAEGLLTDINEASGKMTGYTREELLGRSCHFLQGPDTEPQVVQAIQEAFDGARAFHGEILNYRKDGTPFWNELSIVPVFDADGALNQFVGVQRDISERRAAQAELLVARDAADAANQAKSRFLATMSHEIRTPLNGVLVMAQLLALPKIEERERVDYAGTIVSSGQTLLALLNDILDLSRVEAGSVQLESIPMEPLALITETAALFSEQARNAGLTLEVGWAGASDACYLGDPFRIRQMLSNLVGNAIKFTKQGRIRIEASEISHTANAAMLEFAVRDTGVGIASDKQPLLFQSFSQADTSTTRQYGGSGLGLSIVRNLAELMGGGVGVQSEPGQGSRFWFRVELGFASSGLNALVPLHKGDPPLFAEALPPTQFAGHVLVAEDNRVNQGVIQALLGKHGLHSTLATDGEQALAAVMSCQPFDLVLMDLQMPVMDGCTASLRVRAWEAQTGRTRLPIVALTADAFEDDRQRCLDAGMDEVLTKPIAMEQLQTTFARWLAVQLPAVAEQAVGPIEKHVDVASIRVLISEIAPLLAHHKFDSVACFRQLQDALAGTKFAPDMALTGHLLQECRFDLVQQRLRQMVAEQGWEAAPHD